MSLVVQERVYITKEEWRQEVSKFAQIFASTYSREDVTPYIHILVYHVGFYLERYRSLEMFANYPIETVHFINKHINTNGLSTERTLNNGARQQLTHQFRITLYEVDGTLPVYAPKRQRLKPGRKSKLRNWASLILALQPSMQRYLRPMNTEGENEPADNSGDSVPRSLTVEEEEEFREWVGETNHK